MDAIDGRYVDRDMLHCLLRRNEFFNKMRLSLHEMHCMLSVKKWVSEYRLGQVVNSLLSSASAIHFATMMPIMLGTMNSSSPVSSNMITANEIVILEAPAKNAPAPTITNMPGEMEGTS